MHGYRCTRPPSRRGTAKQRFLPLLLFAAATMSAPRVAADNGDVLSVFRLGSVEPVDVAYDSSDRTFWVLGANGSSSANHRIYHVSDQLNGLLGDLPNPHPVGAIPNFTLNRGIAFEALEGGGRLFILASVGKRTRQSHEVRVIDRNGQEDESAYFTLQLPDDDASLFGLAYDAGTQQLWTLDAQNDKALRLRLDGTVAESFVLPGKKSSDTVLRGRGIALDQEEDLLYVTYGDVFDQGPTVILQLVGTGDQLGTRTGVEIPLSEVPGSPVAGFDVFRINNDLRRVALAGDTNAVFQLEHVVPEVIPPSELECSLNVANQVVLRWKNHSREEPFSVYAGPIQILRNGVPVATVDGGDETFTDATPSQGTVTYTLRSSDSINGPLSPNSSPCTVTVGPGGLIDWASSPGHCFDIAESDRSGDVFISDDTLGLIYRYDDELNLIDDAYASPFVSPGGITYIDAITVGLPPDTFTLTDLLGVTETSGNRLRYFPVEDPTPEATTTINLRFPNDVKSPRISGVTYIGSETPSEQAFAVTEISRDVPEIFVFRSSGQLKHRCSPSVLIPAPLQGGITHDPLQDTFLAVFQDGMVRELFNAPGVCTPSGFEVPLVNLAEGAGDGAFFGGIEISGSTLLVCAQRIGLVTRNLIFPFSPQFVRGDFDDSSEVNLTDAVASANYLFRRGPAPSCADAADANDDGIIDIADPVFLLFWLFVPGSSAPPAPFPDPGDDPTFRDSLGCAE